MSVSISRNFLRQHHTEQTSLSAKVTRLPSFKRKGFYHQVRMLLCFLSLLGDKESCKARPVVNRTSLMASTIEMQTATPLTK